MNTRVDVLRSVKKYLSLHLPNDYDIRIESDDTEWERPSAGIEMPAQVVTGRPQILDLVQPMTIYAWPARAESGDVAKLMAMAVEDLLVQAFRIGGHGGRPSRVPLFDYDGVALTESIVDGTDPTGYLWVQDFSSDVRADPDDPRLQTVLVDLRLFWRREGEIRSGTPVTNPDGMTIGTRTVR